MFPIQAYLEDIVGSVLDHNKARLAIKCGESLLFSLDLEFEKVGEEDGTNQSIKSLGSNGWLNVACGWLNPDRHLF